MLRLYDATEAERSYDVPKGTHLLLAYDEGDPPIVEVMLRIVDEEAENLDAEALDERLVDHWLAKRNDVAALEALISRGYVVDTMEVSARWADLPAIYDATVAALLAVPGALAASAHQSHSYVDGACLYFTFAAKVGDDLDERTATHAALWEAGQRAALTAGASVVPPPRHRPGPGSLRRRGPRTGVRRPAGDEGGARPQRHPESRQARTAEPVGEVGVGLTTTC